MLNFYQIEELKNKMLEGDKSILHFHDACGGQYFTIENMTDKTYDIINKYLSKLNKTLIKGEDKNSFYLK